MGNDVLTLQEVAELLGKSTQTIRRMIKKGDLKAQRIRTAQGFQYGIYRAQVQHFPALSTAQTSGQASVQVSTLMPTQRRVEQSIEALEEAESEGLTSQLVRPIEEAREPTREPLMTREDVEAFLENDFYVLEPLGEKAGGPGVAGASGVDYARMMETQHREKMMLIHILEALQAELREERAKPKSLFAWIWKKLGF